MMVEQDLQFSSIVVFPRITRGKDNAKKKIKSEQIATPTTMANHPAADIDNVDKLQDMNT